MEKVTVSYIMFYTHAGAFRSDCVHNKINPEDVEFVSTAYAFTIHERIDVIDDEGNVYKGAEKQIGPLYYHPDSKVNALEEIKQGKSAHPIGNALLRNMVMNNWDSVIWTRWGNMPRPYDPSKIKIIGRK